MRNITAIDVTGKRVVVRVDFNVPLDKQTLTVTDDTRIRAALPTLQYLLNKGASVVLLSHLGRPKGGPEDKYSLKHIVPNLEQLLATSVHFGDDCISEQTLTKSKALKNGEVMLCENVRFYAEEEKGDVAFAEKLSKLGEMYINDAFGTAHRAHASTAVMAQFYGLNNKAAGFLMAAEVENAEKVLNDVKRPYVAIMGGAKVSDKMLIIENLLDKVDSLLLGGGMVYTFFKAMGAEVGNSLVEEDKCELALQLLEKAKAKGVKLMLPIDSTIADAFNNDAKIALAYNKAIPNGWMGLDIGPESVSAFTHEIESASTILWNGPMGVFEMDNFSNGTLAVAEAIVKATVNGAFSLIGGGDSAAAINKFGFADRVSYVSTGGGALLEYMEGKVLPGVAAL